MTYLEAHISAEGAKAMADFIYPHNEDETVGIGNLEREFRLYPLTVLLAAFDLMRWRWANWAWMKQPDVTDGDLSEYDRFMPTWPRERHPRAGV